MTAGFDTGDWQELLAVAAAIELDLFRELDREPAGAEGLAARLGYNARAVRILLEALAEMGHVYLEDGRYHISDNMRAVAVDPGNPAYAPFAILHQRNLMERWLTIPDVVRTGRQVERPYTRKRREVFIRSMNDVSRGAAGRVVDRCLGRAPNAKTVLDIGGGPGTYAREFTRHCQRVTILDRSEVAEITEAELSEFPGIEFVGGDFNESIPAGPFDMVFMGNIFHIYGPEENVRLLKRVHDSLEPGGVAAIVDSVRGRNPRAPLFAVTMLVNTDTGDTWTEDEYRGWLDESGFTNIFIEDVPDRGRQLILANRAE